MADNAVVQIAEIAAISVGGLFVLSRIGGGGVTTTKVPSILTPSSSGQSPFLPPVNGVNIGHDAGYLIGELAKGATTAAVTALSTALSTAGAGTLIEVGAGAIAWYYRNQLIGVFRLGVVTGGKWVFQTAKSLIQGKSNNKNPPTPPSTPSAPAPVTPSPAPTTTAASAATAKVASDLKKGRVPSKRTADTVTNGVKSGTISKAQVNAALGAGGIAALLGLVSSVPYLGTMASALVLI